MTLQNLERNVFWDGVSQALCFVVVLAALVLLWHQARHGRVWWSGKALIGTLIVGFGLFGCFEAIIERQLLGLHHVNEAVPPSQWMAWDFGFLLLSAGLLIGGWILIPKRTLALAGGAPTKS